MIAFIFAHMIGASEIKVSTESPSLVQASQKLSVPAKKWDDRQAELKDLIRRLNKILSRHGRIVRKGNENSYVESLLINAINQSNKNLKARGLSIATSAQPPSDEYATRLSPHEIQFVLSSMDPYRREYIEQSLVEKNKIGVLLIGRALSLVEIPESLENQAWIDLETDPKTKDRQFDRMLADFTKRAGKKYYVIVLPKVELPDASYSASGNFTVEQMRDGTLNIYQERRRTRAADTMAAQVFTVAPRNLLFVRKEDLRAPLSSQTQIRSFVFSSYGEPPLVDDGAKGEAE